MRIDYIQQGAVGRSEYVNPQRLINLYPQVDKSGRSIISLHNCPGLILKRTLGPGPIRAILPDPTRNKLYVVSGDRFYSLNNNLTATLHGTLDSGTGFVSMSTNGLVVLIVDGAKGWTFTVSGSVFAEVTDPDFPADPTVTAVCDGYFHVLDSGTQRVHFSTTGTAWAALDFFSAEATPDDLVSVISDHNELVLFGTASVELWRLSSTGWQAIDGAFHEYGCAAQGSPAKMDNSVYWLDNENVVRALRGASAPRVSTHAIEYRISQHTKAEIAAARAFSYRDEGHSFYQITVGDETFVYDASIPNPDLAWHQRAHMVPASGLLIQHRAVCHAYFAGMNLVGDYENGKLYHYDLDTFTDNGDYIQATATYKPQVKEGKPIFFHRLEAEVEPGVGIQTGQGSDPQIELGISDDGGKTWGSWEARDIGPVGEYGTTCVWDALGESRNRVFELRITDPVKKAISNLYLQVTPGL